MASNRWWEEHVPWWHNVLMGLVMFGITIALWLYLSSLEAEGGSHRLNWLVAIPYNMGGKPAATALFWLLGFALTGVGIRKLVRSR